MVAVVATPPPLVNGDEGDEGAIVSFVAGEAIVDATVEVTVVPFSR